MLPARLHRMSPLCIPLLASAFWLSGCSHLPASSAPDNVVHDEQQNLYYNAPALPENTPEAEYKPIPAATLYSLLVAEMAGQRQRYDISLYHYMEQARGTRDPAVAERAARIAQFVGSAPHALEALGIWLREDPHNPAAHQAAAQLLMEQGQFEQALQHLEQLQQLAGISQYDYLAANASHLPPAQQQALLTHLESLLKKQPTNASLWYGVAIMHQHLAQYAEALNGIEQALKINPALLSASLQKARILVLLERHEEALSWLEKLRKDYPQHKGIQVLQARILLEQRSMEEALAAFRELHNNFPEDSAILLSLALLEEESGQREQAKAHFYQLLASQSHTSEAHFYLGRIAQDEEQDDSAIHHFSQVESGREFLPAQLQAANLMQETHGLPAARDFLGEQRTRFPRYQIELIRIETELLTVAGEYDAALALLNETLRQLPEHIDLLYTRAMLAERMDNLALLETDLRSIITMQPDHAEALNALGYALADRTDRWADALPLIERAIALTPDNPAVIDSLGWVYFRMGDLHKARTLLERAFNLMQDHEIAAHLGEVLWLAGEQQQAIQVWQQGFAHTPDSDIIRRTLERLQVDPAPFDSARP